MTLVTGCAGFIGSHLTDRLLGLGHQVTGVDNLSRGTSHNLMSAHDQKRFQFIQADMSDPAAVKRVLSSARFDTVWHLVANSDIGAGVADPSIDLRDTFLTTFHLLNAMHDAGVRRIAFASSSAIYGVHEEVINEETGPLLPISSYGAMKLASEAAISAAVERFLEHAWIFRFPNVIGPRATHGIIFDLLTKLSRDAEAQRARMRAAKQQKEPVSSSGGALGAATVLRDSPKDLEVLGDGTQQKPYLHVSELVDAMLFIADRSTEHMNLFNIGPSDEGVTVRQIAEEVIRQAAPTVPIRFTGGKKGWVGDVPKFRYSIDKLRNLGWSPRLSSFEAVQRAVTEIHQEFQARIG